MKAIASVVVVSALGLLASGCGSSRTYSADDVKRTFSANGIQLVSPAGRGLQPRWMELFTDADHLLQPRSHEDFLVLILSDDQAQKSWDAFVAVGPDSNSFDARRANVVVIADDGVNPDTQKRIVASLDALPDHGDTVATLERE